MIILVNAFWFDCVERPGTIKNKNERDLRLFQPYLCSMIAISGFAKHQNAHLHIWYFF